MDDESFVERPVLPGDDVTHEVGKGMPSVLTVGAGLKRVAKAGTVRVQVAGMLCRKSPGKFWVESRTKRYAAAAGDTVLGVVTGRLGEAYRLDIHSSSSAVLPGLEFDGASKRNKPNLQVGALVYARVAVADPDMEPELSCKVLSGPKKDWVTGDCVFGELKAGLTVPCSLRHARSLLDPKCEILQALGRVIPYEIAVGVNGRVWVNSGSKKHTILISNAITHSEHLDDKATRELVNELMRKLDERAD